MVSGRGENRYDPRNPDGTGPSNRREFEHHKTVVNNVVPNIEIDSFIDDLRSVDSKGSSHQDCEGLFHVIKQSPDVAGGVHIDRDDLHAGVDEQSIMFGHVVSAGSVHVGKDDLDDGHEAQQVRNQQTSTATNNNPPDRMQQQTGEKEGKERGKKDGGGGKQSTSRSRRT